MYFSSSDIKTLIPVHHFFQTWKQLVVWLYAHSHWLPWMNMHAPQKICTPILMNTWLGWLIHRQITHTHTHRSFWTGSPFLHYARQTRWKTRRKARCGKKRENGCSWDKEKERMAKEKKEVNKWRRRTQSRIINCTEKKQQHDQPNRRQMSAQSLYHIKTQFAYIQIRRK